MIDALSVCLGLIVMAAFVLIGFRTRTISHAMRPIRDPIFVMIIRRYMEAFHGRGLEGCIFQGPHGDGEPVAGNTQRKWRGYVEEGTGLDLDHRILRRTWGQLLLDRGVPEGRVSVINLMGPTRDDS